MRPLPRLFAVTSDALCGSHGSIPVTDTCLALLFLQRVNLAKDLTDKLLELRALGPAAGAPPARKD